MCPIDIAMGDGAGEENEMVRYDGPVTAVVVEPITGIDRQIRIWWKHIAVLLSGFSKGVRGSMQIMTRRNLSI